MLGALSCFYFPRRRLATLLPFLLLAFLLGTVCRYLPNASRDGVPRRFQISTSLGFAAPLTYRPSLRHAAPCKPELDHLRRQEYNLTRKLLYQKRCVRVSLDQNVDRSAVAHIQQPLIGKGELLRLDRACWGRRSRSCSTVSLSVPAPYPQRDYSHLFFGVATTFERLSRSLPQLKPWLGNSGARLLAIVTDSGEHHGGFGKLALRFREHGMKVLIVRPEDGSIGVNEQHFLIVRDLLWHAARETRWLAIIDDDTFFPSLYPLGQALDRHDHTLPAYLGGLSENFEAVKIYGYMAFGGAGVFLSLPLVRQLEPHIDSCMGEDHVPQGDGLLKHCIYNKTHTKLEMIPGLRQLDMMGDLSGFYESGQLPISLHHRKSWHTAPVEKMAAVTEVCGACFLQRFRFGSDTVLANGYSISVYTDGVDGMDLDRMEGTWDGAPAFQWSMGPMRDKVDDAKKKVFRLIDSEKVGKGLRQVYLHRADGEMDGRGEPVDEVVELWWEW